MTFLPVVTRELRTAARRSATYRGRVILAGVVGGIAVCVLVFGSISSTPSQIGSKIFELMATVTLFFSLATGITKTADSLSEEKRNGTLGLLFLTDLRGYDVVLGKFTALSLGAMHGLLSLLPVMAVSFLLGGITGGEFWRVMLALVNIQFFSLCAGIAVSASCLRRKNALGATLLLLLLVCGLPYALPGNPLVFTSPVCGFISSFSKNYATHAADFLHSLAFTNALGWLMLLYASVMAPRLWHDSPESPFMQSLRLRINALRFGTAEGRAAGRMQLLEHNPVTWLAGRDLGQRRLLWAVGGIGAALATLMVVHSRANVLPGFLGVIKPVGFVLSLGMFSQSWMALVWLINFALKIRLAAHACHCLAEARRNQALEMLLTTPLTVRNLIDGQIEALRNNFLIPAITIFGVEMIGGLIGSAHEGHETHSNYVPYMIRGMGVIYFVTFILDGLALTWAGMWFGLSSRKENEAFFKTILFVLVLPLLGLFFWPAGLAFLVLAPVFWIGYAHHRLTNHFRDVAVQRHGFKPQTQSWLPVKAEYQNLAPAEP
jgi:hypothetical protein